VTAPKTHAAAATTPSPESSPPPGRLDLPFIPTGRKLTGAEREKFAKQVVTAYRTTGRKVTIREICEATNRSAGAIHTILREAGATKRGRRTSGTDEQASS
jgi:hypothetical protein